ncbi:MAG: thiolase family protein [Vicinamibacterales bacterium]
MPDYEPAVILSACRLPIAIAGGALSALSAVDLGAVVVREATRRSGLGASDLGDVILGCVWPETLGLNVGRSAACRAEVPPDVPGETVNRLRGSGLQSVVHAVEATRVGYTEVVLAGGAESMSHVSEATRLDALKLWRDNTPSPSDIEARFGVSCHDQAEWLTAQRALAETALSDGRFAAELVPIDRGEGPSGPRHVVAVDDLACADTPAVEQDNAAALIVATAERAARSGRPPLARILSFASTGTDAAGAATIQATVTTKALGRAKLDAAHIDLLEMNETFAGQALVAARTLAIDPSRVNRHSAAFSLGLCPGAAGARLLVTLVHALRARGGGHGVAALDAGQQMGLAMVIAVDG